MDLLYLAVNPITILCLLVLVCAIFRPGSAKKLPPGPRGLPLLGYLPFLGKEPAKTLLNLSEMHGDIIGLHMGSKFTVVLNEYSVFKKVMDHPASLNRSDDLFRSIGLSGFVVENNEEWQEQRKFCLHAMRKLGLGKSQWEVLVREELKDLCNYVRSHDGRPMDISYSLDTAVAKSVMSLLVGSRLDGDIERTAGMLVDYAHNSLQYLGPTKVSTLLPGIRKVFEWFRIAGYDKAAELASKFHAFIKDEMRKHLHISETKMADDFIDIYRRKLQENESSAKIHYFSENNLQGNINSLFLGATDTMTTSIAWLFRFMAKHQDIQAKIHKELDEVIGQDGFVISYADRHRIPYTFAVMMEAQRYSSIVPLSTTRCAAYDFEINGITIPKDADITGNLWAMHNDPKYWDEPEKFKPERFLTEDGTKLAKTPESYAPFSLGRRKCMGETVAWMGMLLFFTTILHNFIVTPPEGEELNFDMFNALVLHFKNRQKLCFKDRRTM